MNRISGPITGFAVSAILFALCSSAHAQQPPKLPRVGMLFGATPSANAKRVEAFRQGLRERGYAEGKNISIEIRYAGGDVERLPALITELVRLPADVIITGSSAGTKLAAAASTIPIIMAQDSDPVGNGFA